MAMASAYHQSRGFLLLVITIDAVGLGQEGIGHQDSVETGGESDDTGMVETAADEQLERRLTEAFSPTL